MSTISQLTAPTRDFSDSEVEKQRLRETCEEFESILMQYLLKAMRQTVSRAEEPEQAQQVYESMLDQTLATEMSKRQSNGLAAVLYQQLLPSVEGKSSKESP